MSQDRKGASKEGAGGGAGDAEAGNNLSMLARIRIALQRRRERAQESGPEAGSKSPDKKAAEAGGAEAGGPQPGGLPAMEAAIDPESVVAEVAKVPAGEVPAASEGGDVKAEAATHHEAILAELSKFGHLGGGLAQSLKDHIIDLAGRTVGDLEMHGLKYSVKAYEAQVSGQLFRGSRVDDKGMGALAEQGIHGIVSFCAENDNDTPLAAKYGLHALHIPIVDNHSPTFGQVHTFLGFVDDGANQPVYCHCEAGKGRTGTMVACYRMAKEGWPVEAAIDEFKSYGTVVLNQIEFLHKFADALRSGGF